MSALIDLRPRADELMQSLSPANDPDALRLDHDGSCVASFDDWVVQFTLVPASASIEVAMTLTQLASPADAALLTRLLQANAQTQDTGGASFALAADAQTVLWVARQSLALEPEAFRAALEAFLNGADAWAESIRTGSGLPSSGARSAEPATDQIIRG